MDKYVDDADERVITPTELQLAAEVEAGMSEVTDSLCLARGLYPHKDGKQHRTGRCVFTINHDGDHSWQGHIEKNVKETE